MRKIVPAILEAARVRYGKYKSDSTYGFNGAFVLDNMGLQIIASNQAQWDHVSVSHVDRCPTWDEMCFVRNLFWAPDEVVIQYHPSAKTYINVHPFVLHMWRPQRETIPMPPLFMV